jgi:hypothetical protein
VTRYNAVSVLAQQEGELRTVGLLDRIAPREDIRSVRFMGARGYVVTFETIDPLFVLDLEAPRAPRVLSELKVEGFSTYIHPLEDGHLLTIGYESDSGRFGGALSAVQLQLFDVRDPRAPRLAHKTVIGTRGATSSALENHLAFTYYPERRVLALPMALCEGGDAGGAGSTTTFAGVLLYDVDLTSGLRERGRIPFPPLDVQPGIRFPSRFDSGVPRTSCLNSWSLNATSVQRGVMIDDFVYAIGRDHLKVRSLHALEDDVATVSLAADACTLLSRITPHGVTLPTEFRPDLPNGATCACFCFDGTYECTDSLTRASCIP